jgi:uncharacterized spore protein YtfJ
MAEEKDPTPENTATGLVERTLARLLEAARIGAVYGPPIAHGDDLVIPAAEILAVAGAGAGDGAGRREEERRAGRAAGGGGGGRVLSRPVAVVVMSKEGVTVRPIIDPTKIALAALTAAGFVWGAVLRVRRSSRRRSIWGRGPRGRFSG